jgi:hypothetical protein
MDEGQLKTCEETNVISLEASAFRVEKVKSGL